MEQFNNWEEFWKEWHNEEVKTEDDMYFQVGKTINRKPIDKQIFDHINQSIIDILGLGPDETLIELCCGNGLCTYEFSKTAKQVIGVDYAQHLVDTAKKFKSAPNIVYCQRNIFDFLEHFNTEWDFIPSKFLINDALAYFEPGDLSKIIASVKKISGGKFHLLVRGVPNDTLKWNYYNTDERKQRYLENTAKGDFTNDGMGRWWKPEEIEAICSAQEVKYQISNQAPPVSNYRMDILISL